MWRDAGVVPRTHEHDGAINVPDSTSRRRSYVARLRTKSGPHAEEGITALPPRRRADGQAASHAEEAIIDSEPRFETKCKPRSASRTT